MYNLKKIFAKNIKRLRENRRLSQEKFAEVINMQWKSVLNFEQARNLANSKNLENICNSLNIPPAYLFTDFQDDETSIKKIDIINVILENMNEEELDIAYRIIVALNDKPNFNSKLNEN